MVATSGLRAASEMISSISGASWSLLSSSVQCWMSSTMARRMSPSVLAETDALGDGQQVEQVAFDDRRDDRFLVLEVVVDVADAHAGGFRDLRHAGAVEALAAGSIRWRR